MKIEITLAVVLSLISSVTAFGDNPKIVVFHDPDCTSNREIPSAINSFGFSFDTVTKRGLAQANFRLADYGVFIIPSCWSDDTQGALNENHKEIQDFVRTGGVLILFDPVFEDSWTYSWSSYEILFEKKSYAYGNDIYITDFGMHHPIMKGLKNRYPQISTRSMFGKLGPEWKVLARYKRDDSPCFVEAEFGKGIFLLLFGSLRSFEHNHNASLILHNTLKYALSNVAAGGARLPNDMQSAPQETAPVTPKEMLDYIRTLRATPPSVQLHKESFEIDLLNETKKTVGKIDVTATVLATKKFEAGLPNFLQLIIELGDVRKLQVGFTPEPPPGRKARNVIAASELRCSIDSGLVSFAYDDGSGWLLGPVKLHALDESREPAEWIELKPASKEQEGFSQMFGSAIRIVVSAIPVMGTAVTAGEEAKKNLDLWFGESGSDKPHLDENKYDIVSIPVFPYESRIDLRPYPSVTKIAVDLPIGFEQSTSLPLQALIQVKLIGRRTWGFITPGPHDPAPTEIDIVKTLIVLLEVVPSSAASATEPSAQKARPLISYGLPKGMLTSTNVGDKAAFAISVKNIGEKPVEQLWFGLDVLDEEGKVLENTKTHRPSRETGKLGRIKFSNQGKPLMPGEITIFEAVYTFDEDIWGNSYEPGKYMLKYAVWDGNPGDGVILSEIKTHEFELKPSQATQSIREETITSSIGIRLRFINPGEFWMGSSANEKGHYRNESPQHLCKLTKGFYMGLTEVTQAQWVAVMNNRPWSGAEHVKEGPDYPAAGIDRDNAVTFCRKLSAMEGRKYRLPTEAEWEYACRAGAETRFSFGDEETELGEYAWFKSNCVDVSEAYPHPVAKKKPNRWGLYDMHGNVWERCSSTSAEAGENGRHITIKNPTAA